MSKIELPWVDKYRPSIFDEIISEKDIIKTIENLTENKNIPHLLFYGPSGTGKTTTISVCAKKLYGKYSSSMVLELNASNDNGISIIREQIKDFAGTQNMFLQGIKLIILDEADNLSIEAQNALRRVIEKYSNNTRFCLICNYINKIIPAIQSRCARFRFPPLTIKDISIQLNNICSNEGLIIENSAIEALYRISKGDMRMIINIVQICIPVLENKTINDKIIYKCTSKPSNTLIKEIMDIIDNNSLINAFYEIKEITKNYNLIDIVSFIIDEIVIMDIKSGKKCQLLIELAEIENNIVFSKDVQIDIQLGGLISILKTK
jgi:replication factor C subunit 3/5